VIELDRVTVHFHTRTTVVSALREVSLRIEAG
jgi:ABC-type methionine transport system ATPase subunit